MAAFPNGIDLKIVARVTSNLENRGWGEKNVNVKPNLESTNTLMTNS